MNLWTLAGMIFGVALLMVSIVFSAKEPLIFLNAPGAAVVLGGTLAATMITYTPREILQACGAVITTLKHVTVPSGQLMHF